ncbi:NrfD/PsrC family molybdoenzyme membrane anchor subunit [Chloroflexota bacterium]
MAAELATQLVNGQPFKPQHEWGWQVALYLYLAGIGSGALAIGLLVDWLGYSPYASREILLWGPIFVGIGASFLILKLGIKKRFMNTVLNPKTSWLSRGFYILSVCIIVGMALLGISLLPILGININISNWSALIRALEIIAFIFAISTAVYTGILIQSVKFVSFWHTYLLPALFTVSAFSTGAIATVLATYVYDLLVYSEGYSAHMRHLLMNIEQVILPIEAIVLGIYLFTRYKTEEGQSRNSVRLLLRGRFKLLFWLGIVVSGFVLPPILENLYFRSESPYLLFAIVVFVLASGLFLRVAIVYAGIKDQTPWHKFIELRYFLKLPNSVTLPMIPGAFK